VLICKPGVWNNVSEKGSVIYTNTYARHVAEMGAASVLFAVFGRASSFSAVLQNYMVCFG